MSIRDDCIKHKILVQKYATKQSNAMIADIRSLVVLSPDYSSHKLALQFDSIINKQLNELTEFAKYESRFNAKLYSKYLKKQVDAVPIDVSIVVSIKMGLALHEPAELISTCMQNYRNNRINDIEQAKKDAVTLQQDNLETIKDLIYGKFSSQARALITTAINAISLNVRTMF